MTKKKKYLLSAAKYSRKEIKEEPLQKFFSCCFGEIPGSIQELLPGSVLSEPW